MSTVPRARRKRKHNPEILRMKRVARAAEVPWSEVCKLRDMFIAQELETRERDDEARKVGWESFCHWNGWSAGHKFFWRSGFQRYFARRVNNGRDYTIIPHYDEIADSVRAQLPEFLEIETCEIYTLILSYYPKRGNVINHYGNALAALTHQYLSYEVPF